MTRKKDYRWGILGAGRIAEKFCQAIMETEGSSVYAIASREVAKAKDYATRFNASVYYDNYADLCKDEQIDIIYIATPHAFHPAHAMACLQHNKAVVCEKPLSMSYAQTSEMIELAGEKGLFFMEGMWTVCMPAIQKILAMIRDGVIGQPLYVSADFGFKTPVDIDGRLFNKSLGGGSVLDIGIYPITLATLVLGKPVGIKTMAKLAETGVDEYANVILQYGNGATAHVISSLRFNTPIEAEIIGEKGSIKIKNPWFKATDFSVHLEDGTVEEHSLPHESNGFEHEIREVMHCLEHGLLQSEKVPHALSLSVSSIMEEVLLQAGVHYR